MRGLAYWKAQFRLSQKPSVGSDGGDGKVQGSGQAGGAGKEQVGVEGLGGEAALGCLIQSAPLTDDSAILLGSLFFSKPMSGPGTMMHGGSGVGSEFSHRPKQVRTVSRTSSPPSSGHDGAPTPRQVPICQRTDHLIKLKTEASSGGTDAKQCLHAIEPVLLLGCVLR